MSKTTELADRYLAAWNERGDAARRALIAEVYTESATYLDPLLEGQGHAGIDAMIAAAQTQFPGHRFERKGDVDEHHDRARFAWELRDEAGTVTLSGIDFVTLRDGRLQEVVGFFDGMPQGGN
ncbi:MAG: nuclear transport factor 2 family protein [Fimbriimonas sp.]